MTDLLIIGGSFPMPKAGGSINYIYHVLSGLDDVNCVILTADLDHVENLKFDTNYSHKIIRSKYIAHVLDQNPGGWIKRNIILAISIFQSAWYIIKLHPKIIFFTNYTFLTISYLLASPFVDTSLGIFTYAEEIQQRIKKNIHRFLLKRLLKKSEIIVTVCHYTKNLLNSVEKNIDNKITIIIPPVDISSYNKKIERKNNNETINLLTVARLEERKGHIDVLEVIYRLVKKYPNIHYTIVGKGSFESTIKLKIEELSLMQCVELKGRVSDEELEKEYQDADIFVMPHKELKDGDTEGCPTVFLEAGLHYLPVIGGEAGGVSDAIKNGVTGYICHKNTDELYDFLEKLINNKSLRMDMGAKGYQYASQFSTQAQSRKFKEIVSTFLKYN